MSTGVAAFTSSLPPRARAARRWRRPPARRGAATGVCPSGTRPCRPAAAYPAPRRRRCIRFERRQMTTRILRWGHGLGVRLPLSLARSIGLEDGSSVELLLRGRQIVIDPLPAPPSLGQLLAGTTVKLWARWTPGRGDIVTQRGAAGTAGGREHSLVLSPAAYSERTGFAVVCPVREASGPFAVDLPRGLPVQGAVLADRVVNLDVRSCGLRHFCSVPDDVVAAVLERLAPLVGEPPRG